MEQMLQIRSRTFSAFALWATLLLLLAVGTLLYLYSYSTAPGDKGLLHKVERLSAGAEPAPRR